MLGSNRATKDAMTSPTPQEVLMWQLINRARLDPAGEAARYGIDLNEGLEPGTLSAATRQPLAFNNTLFTVADGHSQRMIDLGYFAHNDPNGSTPFTRMTAAGYNLTTAGENISWQGTTGAIDLTAFIVNQERSLFVDTGIAGRGHRLNLLNESFQELGIGQVSGVFQGFNASMVTQDFGTQSGSPGQFLTGVVYSDADSNNFYSAGEGLGAVSVSYSQPGASGATASEVAGNYSSRIAAGVETVTFSGASLPHSVSVSATLSADINAEVDLQLSAGLSVIRTSVSVSEVSGVDRIQGLGLNGLVLAGGAGNESIIGTAGNDTLSGGSGADTLNGGDGDDTFVGEGIDVIDGGAGSDTFFGGQGGALNLNLATASLETVWGSLFGDVMNGATATANLTLVGQGLQGGVNADTMLGGTGNDFVYYRAGDVINGGAGVDWAVATLSSSGATLNLAPTGFENAWGSAFADTLSGAGAAGTVVLVGDAGNDSLTGGSASDFLYGLGDNDTLAGGGGNDNLVGDLGIDTFVFGAGWGADIVWDWADGTERFDMRGSGAVSFAALSVDQNFLGSGNALIGFSDNQILVVGGANQIDAGDFWFI